MPYTHTHRNPFTKFFMPPAMLEELKTTAFKAGQTQQQVMRAALSLYLDHMNGKVVIHAVPVLHRDRSPEVHVPLNIPTPRPPVPRRPA